MTLGIYAPGALAPAGGGVGCLLGGPGDPPYSRGTRWLNSVGQRVTRGSNRRPPAWEADSTERAKSAWSMPPDSKGGPAGSKPVRGGGVISAWILGNPWSPAHLREVATSPSFD